MSPAKLALMMARLLLKVGILPKRDTEVAAGKLESIRAAPDSPTSSTQFFNCNRPLSGCHASRTPARPRLADG
eukprot:scaffold380557_cov31-Prasinocladus_malaysianus.AAC.1